MMADAPLAIEQAARFANNVDPVEWLIERLFIRGGAGILGGAPKSSKSLLALEVVMAVATCTPVAGRFPVQRAAPTLVLNAEDPRGVIAERLQALAAARNASLDSMPLHVVAEHGFLLPDGIARLRATIEQIGAGLVVLDPLIRLHRADENSATEMSRILNGVRSLAADTGCSILLVHHARKAIGASPGQALRGSSDLHAFADSTLFLRRLDREAALEMRIEHKADLSPQPLRLRLMVENDSRGRLRSARFVAADPDEPTPDPEDTLAHRVLAALREAHTPCPTRELRTTLGVRNQDLVEVLREMEMQGRIERVGRAGWSVPVPCPQRGNAGTRRRPPKPAKILRELQTTLVPLD